MGVVQANEKAIQISGNKNRLEAAADDCCPANGNASVLRRLPTGAISPVSTKSQILILNYIHRHIMEFIRSN